jgi:DNA-binding CsgD family transcriptional regulator
VNDLTPTERRVLKLIAEYKTSKEIAEELHVHYRSHAVLKLPWSTRTSLLEQSSR